MDEIELDYESRGLDLTKVGLDRYSASAEIILAAYRINGGRMNLWDIHESERPPAELVDALRDPHVRKWAFNAQFERVMTNAALGVRSPVTNWRCTMVLAYMQSFTGTLAQVGKQMGVDDDLAKMEKEGKALIKIFCQEQKITAKQPHAWRDADTDPEQWETFREYCKRDVVAESTIRRKLLRYPILEEEWALYEIDQIINDRGKPVDVEFVKNAIWMADRRRNELVTQLRDLTSLKNPNSPAQLLPWLRARGYQFNDLGKDTVSKSLREDPLDDDAREALLLRQWAARMSVKKYNTLDARVGEDGNMRYLYQFAGASRTNRWAGRAVQTQNLPRTPKIIEKEERLEYATSIIRRGRYDLLEVWAPEPMEIIVGTVRSAFGTKEGEEFSVCDLASIESVSIGYLAQCKRILQVFRDGKDVYVDFGQELFKKPYDEITKHERSISKPAVLGAGYRLSGGELTEEGKKTGLWGYAEAMFIFMDREQAHASVRIFREEYAPEVVQMWKDYENAARFALMTGKPKKVGPVTFEYMKPYLLIRLPSGRCMYYYKPRIENVTVRPKNGDPYTRKTLTYMGVSQATKKWQRIPTHGGKLVENCLGGETLILTPSGPKRIVEVTSDDLVWDGASWVSHDGLISQGLRETIDFGGVRITPEHRVMVNGEWINADRTDAEEAASSFSRYHRAPGSHAPGASICGIERQEVPLDDHVRLRKADRNDGGRVRERPPEVVRVLSDQIDRAIEYEARHVEASGVCGLAFDERSVPASEPSSIQELRSARHYGMQRVGDVVRRILARYGADVSARPDDRTCEQHGGVQQGELPVGYAHRAGAQSKNQCLHRNTPGKDDSWRGGREVGDQRHDAALSEVDGLAGEQNVRSARLQEPVFDLLNCGPRHRFTVVLPDGRLILVHNCVQAFARDVLAVGIRRAHAAGFNLRGHVHDELIALRGINDSRYSWQALRECMTAPIAWAPGLPLGGAGWHGKFYKKD